MFVVYSATLICFVIYCNYHPGQLTCRSTKTRVSDDLSKAGIYKCCTIALTSSLTILLLGNNVAKGNVS